MRHPGFFIGAMATFALAAGCAEHSAPSTASALQSEAAPIPPEAKLGRIVAEQQCSRCHAIDLTGASAIAEAPPLRDLYKRYAIEDLRRAFVRGIEVAHARMPAFRLSPRDVDNLLAYLRSIDPCAQPSTDEEAMARCFEPL